ncbi:MAG: hypothetical protein JWM41_643 [Gemmatimonadetes bacterium]|nr:hypothetical protein [Gemmatimonadota bacterium]
MRRTIQNLLAAAVAVTACSSESTRTTPSHDSAIASPAGEQATPGQPGGAGSAGSYVGMTYDTLPAGVKSVGGAILSNPGDTRGDYAFDRVTTPRGDMIWLDTVGARTRTVRAELPIPPLARDERVFISSCDAAGHLDPRVIAVVVNEPNVSRFAKVRQAWRANLRGARFEIIPVAGIVCEDPGSGPS